MVVGMGPREFRACDLCGGDAAAIPSRMASNPTTSRQGVHRRGGVKVAALLHGEALLLTACSAGDGDAADRGPFERLVFEGQPLDTDRSWDVEIVNLGELTPVGPGSEWILESPQRSGISEIDGRQSALVEGRGSVRLVRIPLRDEERDFNGVIVELSATPKGPVKTVEVGPFREGTPLVPSQIVEIDNNGDWTTRSLSFKRLAGLSDKPDELRIRFTGGGLVGVVSRVTLTRSPVHAEIDMSAEFSLSWPMVAIGSVYRRVNHVTTDSVTASRFSVEPGDRVEIFLGVDPTYATDSERLTFQCDLSVGGLIAPREVTVSKGEWKRVLWQCDPAMSGEALLEVTAQSTRQAGIGVGVIGDASVSRAEPDAPLALLTTSDTHRADHLSIVNDRSLVRTPHLDDLARTGVLFRDCFSQTNVTNPSHIILDDGAASAGHGDREQSKADGTACRDHRRGLRLGWLSHLRDHERVPPSGRPLGTRARIRSHGGSGPR